MKNIFYHLFVLSFFLLAGIPVKAQDSTICYLRDKDGRIREHNVDFLKMKLDVKFEVKEGKVLGHVMYDFKPIQYVTDTLFLNAPGIEINTVLLDGKPAAFTTDSLGLTIRFLQSLNWNRNYQLAINYTAKPIKGLYFIGWHTTGKNRDKDPYFTRQQIWTQGQGIDNRHWIPCYDDVNDKLITETNITFDSSFTVISNGVLKSKRRNTDGSTTWNYAMSKPMVPYLIMIAIDKYAYKDYKSKNGMVSRQYYYSDRPQAVQPSYQYSAEMMDWLCEQTGVMYPWQVYSNTPVQDFMYGAMENTTATVYGDFYLTDSRAVLERSYIATNAHELTHQWFGDYITEFSGTHHWLHESFATYYAKQFIHKIFGEDRYEWDRRGEQNSAISADRNDRFPVAHTHGGSNRHYPKGSAVIDMIRYVVGDSVYKRSVTAYLKKHALANVVSDDFKRTFMETAGVNLDWFFDEWIYRAGFPEFEVKYEKQEEKVVFFVRQTQKIDELTSYFKMPVLFEVYYKDGTSSSVKAWLSHAEDTVYLNNTGNREIDYTLFDPSSSIIKTVAFNKNLEELCAQAEKAKHFIDRYDALLAMRDTAVELKKDFLIRLYGKGNFHPIQSEILLQLAKDSSASVLAVFKQALHDHDHLVRRSAIENLEEIPDTLLPDAELILSDSSYVNIELALRKLCKVNPDSGEKYLKATQTIKGVSNNVRIAWLEIQNKEHFIQTDNNLYQKMLVDYTSNLYEFRTRLKAIDAIEHLAYCDEFVIGNLLNAATNANGRLGNPAGRCFRSLMKKEENLKMAREYVALNTWSQRERKIIDSLLK